MASAYPNVPDAPGVPAVQRSAQNPADNSTQTALTDSGDQANADIATQWGLYDQDGNLAVTADSVVAFDFSAEARISDYPVENGGFGSYNKVQVPYDIRLVMSCGGTVDDRQNFLGAVQDALQSTTLYNAVTPECVYLDVNVVGLRQSRTNDRSNGLMVLEVALRKVRQTAQLTFTKTAQPSGASTVNDGSVQLEVRMPDANGNFQTVATSH